MIGLLALSLPALPGCNACEPSKARRPAASATAAQAPSAAVPPPPAPPAERRSLAERERLDAAVVLKQRSDVLMRLNEARALARKSEAVGRAVTLLVALQELDPLGGAMALSLAQAALAAGDFSRAARSARVAAIAGAGRDALVGEAERVLGEALEKLGRPGDAIVAYEAALAARREDGAAKRALARLQQASPAPAAVPEVFHVDRVPEACAAVEREVRAGRLPLGFSSGSDAKAVGCVTEATLEVEAPTLRRAHVLRVDVSSAGGADRLLWVAFEGANGVDVSGPVAALFSAPMAGVVNDVVVDLQKIDVLPGGAPEVVVKVMERRTLPDVALNEVLEIDVTRAVLLTVDRGSVQRSREFTLSSRQYRARLDAKSTRMPQGFPGVPGAGRAVEFAMKVAWTGPNGMALTKTSGNAEPPLSGPITLFP